MHAEACMQPDLCQVVLTVTGPLSLRAQGQSVPGQETGKHRVSGEEALGKQDPQ